MSKVKLKVVTNKIAEAIKLYVGERFPDYQVELCQMYKANMAPNGTEVKLFIAESYCIGIKIHDSTVSIACMWTKSSDFWIIINTTSDTLGCTSGHPHSPTYLGLDNKFSLDLSDPKFFDIFPKVLEEAHDIVLDAKAYHESQQD